MRELTDDQVFEIALKLASTKTRFGGINKSFYREIQRVAKKMDLIEFHGSEMHALALQRDDYIKISDIYWIFLCNGVLAPGKDENNPWFPNIHLTSYGEKFFSDESLVNDFRQKYFI